MTLARKVNAIAVIGANYGDEGKGAVVNALSRRNKPEYVIRFNGGGQAGHTVQLQDGTRHVFSTFGSGTFYGADTWYTEDVLVSPARILEERESLRKLGFVPSLHIPAKARVITDYDVLVNQFGETFRKDAGLPHGTCGMGVGECVGRNLNPVWNGEYSRTYMGNLRSGCIYHHLRGWAEWRLSALAKEAGVNLKDYEKAIKSALERAQWPPKEYFHSGIPVEKPIFRSIEPTVIFEGAQGLLLDEDDPDHQPHVTWSKTGLTNVIKECQKYGWHLSRVHYVTRPYLTRHGVGPMHAADPHATIPWKDGKQPVDLTNVDNKWQGDLRYAAMDWGKLQARVNKDFKLALEAWPEEPPQLCINLTCLDQVVDNWLPPALTAPDITGGWLVTTNGLEG